MKMEITGLVSKCFVYQHVKVEHQKPPGLVTQLKTPEWKKEHITMDFIFGLPPTKNNDNIWVFVDKLTKSAHFIPMKMMTHIDVLD